MKNIIFLLLAFANTLPLAGQLPTSNLYVFDLKRDFEKDSIFLANPKYLSNFNRSGYNNHPNFINEEELMYASSTPGQDQPDLYTLHLKSKERTQITDTDAGEYSPRRMPDYFNFSAIRMEYLPNDTLIRLWQFPMDRSGNGRPVFPDKYNVGYYAWLNSRDIVLFKVQTPNQLVKTDIYSGEEELIASNVGRCFLPGPRGSLIYLQIKPDGSTELIQYDSRAYFEDQKRKKIIAGLPGSQDFALLQDGSILAASNSEVFLHRPGRSQGWKKIADLSAYQIKGISRIAVSPNETKIVLVSQ